MSLEDLLARQAGVISRRQALGVGLTRDAVDHRLRLRAWRPLHPRVYLAAGHPLDAEALVRAAVLWAGEGAVLSGAAAAWWHGLTDIAPGTVRVTVPRHRAPRERPRVQVRRRDLDARDVTHVRGVAVTARPLTVLDAAPELGAPFLAAALRRAVRLADVTAALDRCRGTAGSAAATWLLAEVAPVTSGR